MRLIYKPVGELPRFINTNKTTRIEAVREILGTNVAPLYYSLSLVGTFCIAYNERSYIREQPINFFACQPNSPDNTIVTVCGDALFMRTKQILTVEPGINDYELVDCREQDMIFLQTKYLRNGWQHSLYDKYCAEFKHLWAVQSDMTATGARLQRHITSWKKIHPASPSGGCLGGNAKEIDWKRVANIEDMKARPLSRKAFENACKRLGLDCVFIDDSTNNMVFVRSQYSWWRIFYNGHFATSVGHENYQADGYEGIFEEGFHLQDIHGLQSRNIYEVIKYIAGHDKARSLREQGRATPPATPPINLFPDP